MIKIFLYITLSIFISSCAHHRDVRHDANGVNRVLLKAESKEAGARSAIYQANHFCKQYEKTAAFTKEESKYTGTMSESSYKTTKKASRAAQIIGGALFSASYGTNSQSAGNMGGLIGFLGGSIANEMAGKGYTIKMNFKCI